MTISRLFEVLFWTWTLSEMILQVVTRTSSSQGTVKDRGSLLLLLPVIFASIWAASWYSEVHGRSMPGSALSLQTAALALLLAGLAIRWWAILSLGRSFSTNVAIHATQTLHKTGMFKFIRHPSYLGMLLIFAAIGLAKRNWVSLAIMLIFPAAALMYRIHVEEIALRDAFGKDYEDYRKSTKRLVPGLY